MNVEKIKQWWNRWKLLMALKGTKDNFVSMFFLENEVVFVVSKKAYNEFFKVSLSDYELALMENMVDDGEFIVFGGRVTNVVVDYILRNYKKWGSIECWSE